MAIMTVLEQTEEYSNYLDLIGYLECSTIRYILIPVTIDKSNPHFLKRYKK